MDPGETFWTEDEIAEELRLYDKDEANETLEKLFQVRHTEHLARKQAVSDGGLSLRQAEVHFRFVDNEQEQ